MLWFLLFKLPLWPLKLLNYAKADADDDSDADVYDDVVPEPDAMWRSLLKLMAKKMLSFLFFFKFY